MVTAPADLEFNLDIPFIERALSTWGKDLRLKILRNLVGGRSSASVLLVELHTEFTPGASATDATLTGQFILKVDEKKVWDTPEPNEIERHNYFTKLNAEFSSNHVPKLVRNFEGDQKIALLYEIAGKKSSVNLVTFEGLDAGSLERRCLQVSYALLQELNKGYKTELDTTPFELITKWLGYRLDPKKAPSLHDFVLKQTQNRPIFISGKRVLINPLWLCTSTFLTQAKQTSAFFGLLHGDFHEGNLLFDRRFPQSELFWLIDLALANEGPLGFDHSYLELSLLLRDLAGKDPERMLAALDALDAPQNSEAATLVPPEHLGLVNALRAIRAGAHKWQEKFQPNRPDPYHSQTLLARIAVSINWANKPIAEGQRRLALAYGGMAATRYLQEFHKVFYETQMSEAESPPEILNALSKPEERILITGEWANFWRDIEGFDDSKSKYVLVTGKFPLGSEISTMGFLPWSAVIDLDPASDAAGLHFHAAPVLEKKRSIAWFGTQVQPLSFDRGTAWMMAYGWTSRNEVAPDSLKGWRRLYLKVLRSLFNELRRASSPQPVKIVVFVEKETDTDLIQRILETADEELQDDATTLLVTTKSVENLNFKPDKHYSLEPRELANKVRTLFGQTEVVPEPQIPGIDGPVAIKVDRLRNLEEDLIVVHSNILETSNDPLSSQDDFWRGNPPTWTDLHADVDITREIHHRLVKEIGERLDESKNSIVELHHAPGAGGTTAALRIAWTLRNSAPTTVLRRYSQLTADRIDELFHLAQLPVLVVADASELAPSARSDLYLELARRNSRAVIFYVVRSASLNSEGSFSLPESMQKNESDKFYRAFAARTKDPGRIESLKNISFGKGLWETYRHPFFYGLTVYEREFANIQRYVQTHVEDLGPLPRDVVMYLSLVTRYSQVGISESMVKRMFNMRTKANFELRESLGLGPSRLIIKRGTEYKVCHPLIAEEILRQLMGGGQDSGWTRGLKDLCVKLIKEVVSQTGPDAFEAQKLLFQLFIFRDEWVEEGAQRHHFSALIEAIESDAGQYEVLQLLTEVCPDEPHYWNHLGRHHIYRTRQDFSEAQKYLERAVELSEGNDAIHHHGLGMVRRFWIDEEVKKEFTEKEALRESPTAESILLRIEHLAEAAFASFSKARDIAPDDQYGYVTHVQTFLRIAESLRQASGKSALTELLASTGVVGIWLRKHVSVAEQLLSRVRHLRGQRKQSELEVDCSTRLTSLYGKFDDLITSWSLIVNKSREGGFVRRALAGVYLAKRQRKWSSIPSEDLRKIVELMENNLGHDPTNTTDLRMWFHAYKRLPEFNYFTAIDRLEAWATREDSLDAHYYLYILHYLRWREGAELDEKAVATHLQKCNALRQGQRGFPYEWLSLTPRWCPIVHFSELGTWDPQYNSFSESHLLVWVEGTILTLKRQAGTIRLGKTIRAFFVPPPHIREAKDMNAVVHFHLGFSYDGLRAWSVDLGKAPNSPHNVVRGTQSIRSSIRMYISNLAFETTSEALTNFLKKYCAVEDVSIVRDDVTGRSLGYGFCKVMAVEDADKLIASCNGAALHGRELIVRIAQPKGGPKRRAGKGWR